MGVRKSLRDVAAEHGERLDRQIVEEVRAYRDTLPTGARPYMTLDIVEVDAMLRVIDSATVNH